MTNFIKARQAFEESLRNRSKIDREKIELISHAIYDAVNEGLFEVTIFERLSGPLINLISQSGYTIKATPIKSCDKDRPDADAYIIQWDFK
jgi:hypothetical protein